LRRRSRYLAQPASHHGHGGKATVGRT
jgi:hypothetical protein